MSFESRSELVTSVKAWLRRTKAGDPLAERVDDLLRLCEADLANKLRNRWLLARSRGFLDRRWRFLPDDTLHVHTVWLVEDGKRKPVELDYITPDSVARIDHEHDDRPRRYTIVGRQIGFFPYPELEQPASPYHYDLIFFRRPTRLLQDGDSNVVLQRYPSIYLYGTLRQAAPFLRDDPSLALWDAAYTDALEAANAEMDTPIGGPLHMRLG